LLTAIVRRLAPAALGVGVLVLPAATALPAAAAAGALDPNFGQRGIVTVASDSSGGSVAAPSAMLVQPDGKILVVDGSEILRFNPDGSLDPGFGNGGRVATPLDADVSLGADAALQPDGKIVVAGRISVGVDRTDVLVMRFNPDGSPDISFGSNGQVVTDPTGDSSAVRLGSFGDAVIVQSDGKILVGGWAAACIARSCPVLNAALVRYNTNGSLDSGFGHGGIVRGEPDATFATVGENSAGEIFALDANGGISEFTADGAARPTANATSISITSQAGGGNGTDNRPIFLSDGRYVIAQGANDAADGPRDGDVKLVRFLGTDAVDTSFNNPAFNYGAETSTSTTLRHLDQGFGLARQSDGKVIVVGSSNGGAGIARVDTNGSLDAGFGTGGTIVDTARPGAEATVATIQPDGKILVAESQLVSTTVNLILARYQAS
jgi:uncharacterized delta-60 repeat protein